MAGTKAGGVKAAATIKARNGSDFYKRIGAIGGKKGHTGGFAANPQLARIAGSIGGKISKRGKAKGNKSAEEKLSKAARREVAEYEKIYG